MNLLNEEVLGGRLRIKKASSNCYINIERQNFKKYPDVYKFILPLPTP